MIRTVVEQVKIDFLNHTFQHVYLQKPIEVVVPAPRKVRLFRIYSV